MRNFIYKNSNRSGIGDRLFDLILVYTYCKYLKYDKLYLNWDENNLITIGNGKSIHSKLRIEKTPFRSKDYLLNNLQKYINLPEDIVFVNKNDLNNLCNDNNNFVFTKDLQLGDLDNEVLKLQKFLNSNDYVVSETGDGSLGNETNYFGQKTLNALISYQIDNNIIPSLGFFGPITREKVNKETAESYNF